MALTFDCPSPLLADMHQALEGWHRLELVRTSGVCPQAVLVAGEDDDNDPRPLDRPRNIFHSLPMGAGSGVSFEVDLPASLFEVEAAQVNLKEILDLFAPLCNRRDMAVCLQVTFGSASRKRSPTPLEVAPSLSRLW